MAPRRRPLKKGESRMNAALDAMTPLGFDKKLVHQTVNKLLKVYDSSEGWGFIEDGAYHLLIDQLLEAQQQTQQQDHHFHIDQLLEAQQQDQLMICGYLTGGIVVRPDP
ncbi:ubiquitin-binding WIYLD domain protein [Medicago truncatula]|uniref:Ubiquitin-binding WIYLD domain protein n=1 Tax=Medicago truncatula TaxID=3880 RepID=A0A072U8G4_MEDTR|nr:ubiquitin-binding WIYLD domain protein [Medicago truncatula]